MPAEESFSQLKLQFIDPIQHDYELVRPAVCFHSQSLKEVAKQKSLAPRSATKPNGS
jgi:hypothetical protein